jgi:hypothetical protein
LTFAQYGCIAAVIGGVWLLACKRGAEPLPVAVATPAPRQPFKQTPRKGKARKKKR